MSARIQDGFVKGGLHSWSSPMVVVEREVEVSASYSDVVGSKYAQLNTRAEITRRCKVHLNLRLHQGYISRFQPLSDKFLTENLVEYEEMKPQ